MASWSAARASDAVSSGAYLAVALALLVAGTAFAVTAPRHPTVRPVALSGAGISETFDLGPGYGMVPLLVALAVAPPALAVILLLARRREAALSLMAFGGLAAVCRLAADSALVMSPLAADRAELWVPHGIDAVRPGPGTWLLLAGHVCTAAAGAFALAESARRQDGSGFDGAPGRPEAGRPVMPIAVGFAVLAGAGLLAAPFRSSHPYVSSRSVFDAPPAVSLGGFALAAGIVLAAGLAGSSPDHRVTVAGLVAAALAVVGVALPKIVVAARAPDLAVAPGPAVALLGAVGLAASARWVGVRAWTDTSSAAGRAWSRSLVAEGARVLAGVLCLVSGACAICAFSLHPLRLADGMTQPRIPTAGLLLFTGSVLAVLGWLTAMPRYGRILRPGLAVVSMAMPVAAAEYIAAVAGVLDLPGVGAGPGAWFALAAVLAALSGALLAVVCGGFERDDVDLTGRGFSGPTAPVSAGAAVLALPAFMLPLVNGAASGVTGVVQGSLGLSSWALFTAMVVTVGVGLLGPRCRPVPAAVLYTAGCVLLVLRLARVVLGPRPLPTTGLAEGAWATVLCLLLMLAAATIAVHTAQAGALGEPGALSSPTSTTAMTRRFRT